MLGCMRYCTERRCARAPARCMRSNSERDRHRSTARLLASTVGASCFGSPTSTATPPGFNHRRGMSVASSVACAASSTITASNRGVAQSLDASERSSDAPDDA